MPAPTQNILSDVWSFIEKSVMDGSSEIRVSMPHTLYLTDRQAKLFEDATARNPTYLATIDEPIMTLIKDNCDDMFRTIAHSVNFIDLGPGYPLKSLIIIDYLKKHNVSITYHAVDVSRFFLDRAITAVSQRGIQAIRIARDFKELEPILDRDLSPDAPRIVFLGLTFNNFPLGEITDILHGLIRSGDICLICVNNPDADIDTALAPYMGDKVKLFAFQSMVNLGFHIDDFKYATRVHDFCVQLTLVLKHDIAYRGLHIPAMTTFITSETYRLPLSMIYEAINKSMRHLRTFTDHDSGLSLISLTGQNGHVEHA